MSHIRCCCLKGDVANCALTDEWYCPEGKVLVGLDGTQANCCDVVEKKKGKNTFRAFRAITISSP